MFKNGLYEQLINSLISNKLNSLDLETIYYKTTPLEKSETSTFSPINMDLVEPL